MKQLRNALTSPLESCRYKLYHGTCEWKIQGRCVFNEEFSEAVLTNFKIVGCTKIKRAND